MWERFSFYGMQAILAYYLYSTAIEGGLGMEKTQATALVGAYGALLYLFTYAGGWISDRILGAEKTLLTGSFLLICGHIALSTIPGYAGLACGLLPIALGSGFLKTAAITILGSAFPREAGPRDGAFQIFYLGINIGALLGPLLTGWIAEKFSYHAGFLCAALLMACGIATYFSLRQRVLSATNSPEVFHPQNPAPPRIIAFAFVVVTAATAAFVALFASGALTASTLALGLVLTTSTVAITLFATMLRSPALTKPERSRVVAFLPLFICSIAYWTLQPQIYGVLAVYSDLRLDRTIGDFTIPAAWTQSLNPLFILIFSLPLASALNKHKEKVPSRQTLMSIGIIMAGIGMLFLLPFVGGGEGSTPFMALAACILAMSLGELFIGPVGMAASAAHAPRAFATRFSALYFLTMAIGTSLAGYLSTFYNPEDSRAESTYLLMAAAIPIMIGLALFATRKRFQESNA